MIKIITPRVTRNKNTNHCPSTTNTNTHFNPFDQLKLNFLYTNVAIDFQFINTDDLEKNLLTLLENLKTWIDRYLSVMNAQHSRLNQLLNTQNYNDESLQLLDRAITKTKRAWSTINTRSVNIQMWISEIFTMVEQYLESRYKVASLVDRM